MDDIEYAIALLVFTVFALCIIIAIVAIGADPDLGFRMAGE